MGAGGFAGVLSIHNGSNLSDILHPVPSMKNQKELPDIGGGHHGVSAKAGAGVSGGSQMQGMFQNMQLNSANNQYKMMKMQQKRAKNKSLLIGNAASNLD